MKRNQFLKTLGLFGLFGSSLKQGKTAILPKSSGLVQVKPFNSTTITQAVAAVIMSLVAWNHLNEERFANSFIIKQQYKDPEIKNGQRRGVMTRSEDEKMYPREGEILTEEDGVTIYSPTTEQTVRIWPDGDWTCTYRTDKGRAKDSEYRYIVRNTKTGKEHEDILRNSGHGLNQVKVIDLYLKLGFYQYK